MKSIYIPMAMQNGTKRIHLGLVLAIAVTFLHQDATATIGPIDLGTASSFAVLGGSGIANAGATTINGDVGTFPTATIGGFGTVTLNGTNYGGGPFTQNAKIDLNTAYTNVVGISPTTIYDPIFDLGGLTLTTGVYNDSSSFGITGTLTLDAQGDPNAVWIFQAGSTLITTANSMITLTNGAQASNVFWQVGSSATLGTDIRGRPGRFLCCWRIFHTPINLSAFAAKVEESYIILINAHKKRLRCGVKTVIVFNIGISVGIGILSLFEPFG
jgi:hypothetical protein